MSVVLHSAPRSDFYLVLGLAALVLTVLAQEAIPGSNLPAERVRTNESQELQGSQGQIQEEIRSAMAALERSRKESETAATRQAENIVAHLDLIERNLSLEREQAIEAVQSSNRMLLLVAGFFASVGLLAIVIASWLQLRAMNRLAEVASSFAHPPDRPLLAGIRGPGEDRFAPTAMVNTAPQPADARLENRVRELEEGAPQLEADPKKSPTGPGVKPLPEPGRAESQANTLPDPKAGEVSLLLGKGQTHLSLNEPEKALSCFDSVLAIDPQHTAALLKKGTALERLNRLEEAVSCYDRAIAINDSVTLAYLYKGGIYNQLERFDEALECYERALRSQQRSEPAPTAAS